LPVKTVPLAICSLYKQFRIYGLILQTTKVGVKTL